MNFPNRAASNVVAGVVLGMIGTVVWAATLMTWRDWLWLGLFAASCAGLIYFRFALGLVNGKRGKGEKGLPQPPCPSAPLRPPTRPLILSLHDSGALQNGRPVHHQQKHKL